MADVYLDNLEEIEEFDDDLEEEVSSSKNEVEEGSKNYDHFVNIHCHSYYSLNR